MGKSVVMPFVNSAAEAVELAGANGEKKQYFRKEILPSGTRNYKGQKLDFSKINPACVQAFDDGAFDSVPFVLTTSDNQHPEKGDEWKHLEGDLHKLEMAQDGRLLGYFDFSGSEKVPDVIKKSNGKFGVSGRIEVGYKAEDSGKEYEYALSHVCGTTRPHVKGMKPWEAVTLSDEVKGGMVLDFSTEVLDAEMNNTNDGTQDEGDIEVPGLDKATVEWLNKFAKDSITAEQALAAAQSGGSDSGGGNDAQLSEEVKKAIELSETNSKKALELAETAFAQAAEARWEKTESELVTGGVPPALLTDDVKKFMKSHRKASIKLSEDGSDTELDAHEVIAGILAQAKGIVDMTEESGTQLRSAKDGTTGDDKDFAAWATEWGHGDLFPVPGNGNE